MVFSACNLFLGFLIFILVAYIFHTKIKKPKKKIGTPTGDYKLICVINKSLKMSKGKTLSQFGHGIDGIHEIMKDYPKRVSAWRNNGSAKIALKASFEELNQIFYAVKIKGLPYYRVFDAGKTQVRSGSFTCMMIGPATNEELIGITDHLPLC